MSQHSFANPFRAKAELNVAIVALACGTLIVTQNQLVVLSPMAASVSALPFFMLGARRLYQGLGLWRFHRRLRQLRHFGLSADQIPLSPKRLYVGKGFRFTAKHRQRLHLLNLEQNEKYRSYGIVAKQLFKLEQAYHPQWMRVLRTRFSPIILPLPIEIEGKPWLHGVGADCEQNCYLPQATRNTHMVVFGTTGVGKTRLMSTLINQDIRNGDVVIVLDPKGDLELMQDMYQACQASGRLNDFIALHAGVPSLSAYYNPLASYQDISEVAGRVTNAIAAEGEGKQFADFAWKFLNITVSCLAEMDEPLTYESLNFFIMRPNELLYAYAQVILRKTDPNFDAGVQEIIAINTKTDKAGNIVAQPSKKDATRAYVQQMIESYVARGAYSELFNSNIADLFHAASMPKDYYSKITASLGPVFDKIIKTPAGKIFGLPLTDKQGDRIDNLPIIHLESAIQKKQIIYVGLDAMTNKQMSEAVGQAIIADLVSLCGRRYKQSGLEKRRINVHADEFAEIVRKDFVTLLNKARGAGVQVTAYTQTIDDIGAAFSSNSSLAGMLLGNFGATIMMRVKGEKTAKTFIECLEKVTVRSVIPSTSANDKADASSGELFTTSNTDLIKDERTDVIEVSDLTALPIGQAFVRSNGGELYKVRLALPVGQGSAPKSLQKLLAALPQHQGGG